MSTSSSTVAQPSNNQPRSVPDPKETSDRAANTTSTVTTTEGTVVTTAEGTSVVTTHDGTVVTVEPSGGVVTVSEEEGSTSTTAEEGGKAGDKGVKRKNRLFRNKNNNT